MYNNSSMNLKIEIFLALSEKKTVIV